MKMEKISKKYKKSREIISQGRNRFSSLAFYQGEQAATRSSVLGNNVWFHDNKDFSVGFCITGLNLRNDHV
jgi:hypothetical protein